MPEEDFVKVNSVVRELNFQRERMINFMQDWKIAEDIIQIAVDYFDIAIHGIKEHIEHYKV